MTKISIDDQIKVLKAINKIWSYKTDEIKPIGYKIARKLTDKEIVEGFGNDPFSHKLWQFDESIFDESKEGQLFDQIMDSLSTFKSTLDFLLSVKLQVEKDLNAKMVNYSCYEAIGEYE